MKKFIEVFGVWVFIMSVIGGIFLLAKVILQPKYTVCNCDTYEAVIEQDKQIIESLYYTIYQMQDSCTE